MPGLSSVFSPFPLQGQQCAEAWLIDVARTIADRRIFILKTDSAKIMCLFSDERAECGEIPIVVSTTFKDDVPAADVSLHPTPQQRRGDTASSLFYHGIVFITSGAPRTELCPIHILSYVSYVPVSCAIASCELLTRYYLLGVFVFCAAFLPSPIFVPAAASCHLFVF